MDIGYTSLAGAKTLNEDFAGAMLPEDGREDMRVSAGGLGQ